MSDENNQNVDTEQSKPTILIVDDLSSNLMVLKHLLDSFDVEIVEAKTGNDTLDKAQQLPRLALVILDVQLPDINGFEVAEILREKSETRHVPIIFVSAVHQEKSHVLKGYRAGAIDYITKPIVPYILISKVRIFIELWRLREDLNSARISAQSAAQAKDRFLSTMSHEIRTPMNGVIGVAELLSQTRLDETQQRYVDTILKSGELLLTILNDILDIAKLEAGKVMLEHISFDLKQLCEEVLTLLKPNRFGENVSLIFDYDDQLPNLFYGDPARIRQILFNLVGNALKFTEHGHIKLSVTVSKSQSDLCEVQLTVEDTGIGIAEDKIGQLFQPFNQADASINRQFGGTGLGLAICKNLTYLMGGELQLSSTLGQGSEFKVILPLLIASEKVPQSAKKTISDSMTLLSGHVLLAEDTQINQMVAVSMLEKLGLTVSIAEDGQQAVEIWRHVKPTLILMDCTMPVINGFDACRLIRSEEGEAGSVPIIALTADASEENRTQCLAVGMNEMITKPFSIGVLAAKLKPWLEPSPEQRSQGNG